MRNTLIKSLVTITFVVIVFVAIARVLGRSETISDYAAKQQTVVPEIEIVEETAAGEMEENAKNNKEAADNVESDLSLPDGESKATALPGDDADSVAEGDDSALADDENKEADETAEADAFYIEEITDELKNSMRGKSYADGIDESKVNFSMLRHVVILYNNFENESVVGELVCNEAIAEDLLEIFEELYYAGYQFEEVSLIDKYDGDDTISMEHNNTSCFNYRVVDNSTRLSNHAYGRAIDVNPFYNPYVTYGKDKSEHVSPEGAEKYADRTEDFQYKIDENDLAYKLFKEHGFAWGGNWNSCKDYQHFEKKG